MPPQSSSWVIAGIDPGLTSGGLVFWNGRTILGAYSQVPTRTKIAQAKAEVAVDFGDRNFAAADIRARDQAAKMLADFDAHIKEHGPIQAIAIESFVDQRSRAREEKQQLLKDRWKTPLLIGHLSAGLRSRGYSPEVGNLVYQDAGVVIRHFRSDIDDIARSKGCDLNHIAKGSSMLTNDHLRKAWAHSAWLYERWRHIHQETDKNGK